MTPELEQNNYLIVPNFLTSEEVSSLLEDFSIAHQDNKLFPDIVCPTSPAIYNMLPCIKMLVKKVPDVSRLCGADVLPTYTYGRVYSRDEELCRHRDRDACEISVTVNLERDEVDWPIWVQKPNGEEVGHVLNPGEAMIYFGCTADHWREEYKGNRQIQVFFHYVVADGPRAYTFFDIAE